MSSTNPIWSKMYTKEEQSRIDAIALENDKYENFFQAKREKWNKELDPIFKAIYQNNFTLNNSRVIVDAQANALSLRQKIQLDISKYAQKLAKQKSINKELAQEKFIFYSTGFGLKTNLGEKKLLIDGHLRENERQSNLIETYIDFLRETSSTLESFQYSVKNVISLIEYLGK